MLQMPGDPGQNLEKISSDRLGQILKDIHIPDAFLRQLERSLLIRQRAARNAPKATKRAVIPAIGNSAPSSEQAYMDKLDGKITEEVWARRSAHWQQEEAQYSSRKNLNSMPS